MSTRRFRIAFSFAGKSGTMSRKSQKFLQPASAKRQSSYDKYHQAEFSRSNLAFYLPDLYEKEADLIVAVICPDYEKKEWFGLDLFPNPQFS